VSENINDTVAEFIRPYQCQKIWTIHMQFFALRLFKSVVFSSLNLDFWIRQQFLMWFKSHHGPWK